MEEGVDGSAGLGQLMHSPQNRKDVASFGLPAAAVRKCIFRLFFFLLLVGLFAPPLFVATSCDGVVSIFSSVITIVSSIWMLR